MNSEIKAKWIKALESGDYKQGEGYLCKDDKFCCLGVLCDLAVKEGIIEKPSGRGQIIEYDGGYSLMPLSVSKWAEVGTFGAYAGTESLVNDNDELGHDFKQIAETIRKYF